MRVEYFTVRPTREGRQEISTDNGTRFATRELACAVARRWLERACEMRIFADGWAGAWSRFDPSTPEGAVKREVRMINLLGQTADTRYTVLCSVVYLDKNGNVIRSETLEVQVNFEIVSTIFTIAEEIVGDVSSPALRTLVG